MIDRFASAVLDVGALVATDRRWTAPLSAIALGFGLFVGVAIGPASDRSAAITGQVVQVVGSPPASPAAEASVGASESGSEPGSLGGALPASALSEPSAAPAPGGRKKLKPEGQRLAGIVVHVNPAAASYSLADQGGQLYAVHARALPAPGLRVRSSVRQLANGTYAQRGKRERLGTATRATFSGVVTFVDPGPAGIAPDQAAAAYSLSVPGASVWVRQPVASTEPLPPVGSFADVSVHFEPSPPPQETLDPALEPEPTVPRCARAVPPPPAVPASVLVQDTISLFGSPGTYADLAGTVQAVCPDTGELVLSADDIRDSGRDLTLSVPAGFDLSRLAMDDPIRGTASIAETGQLTLSGLAGDRGIAGADDRSALQGDLAGG
jgi:hypothetical protein